MHISGVTRIIITLLSFAFLSESQNIRWKIQEICKTLIIDKKVIECFDSPQSLSLMEDSVRTLKKEILLPLRRQYDILDESEEHLSNYYLKLQHISNQIKSIECKKRVVKKGVLKKIKKFLTTEKPAVEEEEEWDGWTVENLKLMVEYYEEMQQELEEIRKLVK